MKKIGLSLVQKFDLNFQLNLLVNIINFVFPILTFIVISLKNDLTVYGILSYHQYLTNIIYIFFDFGISIFGLSELTKDISRKIFIVTNIYSIQIYVLVFILVFLTGFIFVTHTYNWYNVNILILFTIAVLFNTLTPTWVFIANNDAKKLIKITILSKVLMLILLLVYFNSSLSILFIPLIYIIGNGVLLLFSINDLFSLINLSQVNYKFQLELFKKLKSIFYSKILFKLFTSIPPFFIKIYSTYEYVAAYTIIEKISSGLKLPFETYFVSLIVNKNISNRIINIFKASLSYLAVVNFVFLLISYVYIPSNSFIGFDHIIVSDLIFCFSILNSYISNCILLSENKFNSIFLSLSFGILIYFLTIIVLKYTLADYLLIQLFGILMMEISILIFRLKIIIIPQNAS